MNQESIYNIIPKEYQPPPKEKLYRSKFPPNIPPTGTTFCLNTTSKPIVFHILFRIRTLLASLILGSKLILNMGQPRRLVI